MAMIYSSPPPRVVRYTVMIHFPSGAPPLELMRLESYGAARRYADSMMSPYPVAVELAIPIGDGWMHMSSVKKQMEVMA